LLTAAFTNVAASHSHRISGMKGIETGRAAPSFCFYGLGSIVSGYVCCEIERLVIVAAFHADGRLANIEVLPILLAESGVAQVPSPEATRPYAITAAFAAVAW
jgi:hypothetical protein